MIPLPRPKFSDRYPLSYTKLLKKPILYSDTYLYPLNNYGSTPPPPFLGRIDSCPTPNETKPDKPTKMPACLQNISRWVLSIQAFSSDGHYGLIVSLHAQALWHHMSNLNQSELEKI